MTTTRTTTRRAAAAALREQQFEPASDEVGTRRSIVIERVEPQIDGGRHAVKRVVGDTLRVTADIFADGHDLLDAALLVRAEDEAVWSGTSMRHVDNDLPSVQTACEQSEWT